MRRKAARRRWRALLVGRWGRRTGGGNARKQITGDDAAAGCRPVGTSGEHLTASTGADANDEERRRKKATVRGAKKSRPAAAPGAAAGGRTTPTHHRRPATCALYRICERLLRACFLLRWRLPCRLAGAAARISIHAPRRRPLHRHKAFSPSRRRSGLIRAGASRTSAPAPSIRHAPPPAALLLRRRTPPPRGSDTSNVPPGLCRRHLGPPSPFARAAPLRAPSTSRPSSPSAAACAAGCAAAAGEARGF